MTIAEQLIKHVNNDSFGPAVLSLAVDYPESHPEYYDQKRFEFEDSSAIIISNYQCPECGFWHQRANLEGNEKWERIQLEEPQPGGWVQKE